MAELLQPVVIIFDNIEFRYGFNTNGICGNVNLEPCYNGDFESVELENFGGVDNYYFYPPLGVFFPQSFHYNIGANLMGFESCPENSNIGVINSVLLLQAQAAGWTCCKEETYQ
ncbi:hypothetical protein GBA52_000289 [Prunus armeniaca]|nr:hypothetical protein GBA52_000289 [Prunus armeniaca]